MSHLTQAQIAALQQMGICVWISAESLASADKADTGNIKTPTSSVNTSTGNSDSAARVAQLRASLSGDTNPAKAPSSKAAAQPMTEKQQQDNADFLRDLEYAWSLSQQQSPLPELLIGDTLCVRETTIEFPAEPAQLSAAQKAQLWSTLCQK